MFRFTLLILMLCLAGCWPLRALDDAAPNSSSDASSDIRMADGASGDFGPDLQMDVGDLGVADMDLGPPGVDVGGMGDMGAPRLGTLVTVDTCVVPSDHQRVGEMVTGNLAEPIAFAPVSPTGGPAAELAWIDDGEPLHARIELANQAITMTQPLRFPTSTTSFAGLGITVGTDDLGSDYIWAASSRTCSDDQVLWGGSNGMQDFQISNCSQSTPQIITMEVGGGINPYAQSVLSLSRRFVWQEVGNGVIASGGLGFSESDAISGEFAGVVAVPGESFLIATAGALAFFPDQSGALFAWDTGQPSDQTPAHESPPVSVDGIQRVTRGSIDVVYLEDQRYLVARVVGSQVVVEEWTGTANTSDFTLRGEWWRSDGLSRPDDVELATFDGGFALFYQQRVAGAGNSWTVQPFEIAGDTLTEYRCAYSYEYAELEFIDNDLIAFREGENLFVVAAVRFRLNGEFINIEGPAWSGLFQ